MVKNGWLVCFETDTAPAACGVFHLAEGRIEAKATDDFPHCLFLKLPSERILFSASDAEVASHWAIGEAIETAFKNPESLRRLQVVPPSIKAAVRAGIPDLFRGSVWARLSGATQAMELHPDVYAELKAEHTPAEARITRDLARTLPDEEFFQQRGVRGQCMLNNVIRAYAVYDPQVGYCQGVNFLTAVLLLHMREEEAFWTLERLMTHYHLRHLFLPGSPNLAVWLYKLRVVLEMVCPRLARHLDHLGVEVEVYTQQWLITMFSYLFPRALCYRVWDLVMVQGFDVVIRVAVAALRHCQRQLVSSNFEDAIFLIKGIPTNLPEPAELIEAANSLYWVRPSHHTPQRRTW